MQFRFTDDQIMISDTADAFLSEVSSSEAVRAAMATECGYDDEVWGRMVEEMAWTGTHVPEFFGGLSLGYVELTIILEQMGRYLFCSPFYSSVCLAQNALLIAGSQSQKSEYLKRLIAGEKGTLAYTSGGHAWDSGAVEAIFEQERDGFLLNGDYKFVIDGHTADWLIVAARESRGGRLALFIVNSAQNGVTKKWQPTLDQTRKQARVILKDAKVSSDSLLGEAGDSSVLLEVILDLAAIGIAADQLGGAQKALDLAVDFSLDRAQFGRQIGSFQAIKHKAADMMLKVESARSALYYAACIADQFFKKDTSGDQLKEAASIAKAYCSDAYFFVTGSAIQIHGGVGFTEEYDIQLYFKRAKSTETFLGNAIWHRDRLAKSLLDD